MAKKKQVTVYAVIKVKLEVNEDASIEDTIDEFSWESSYEFPSTKNIKVINTEWLDTTTELT